MPLTLQQAFEQYKAARAVAAEKKTARSDAEERAKVAIEESRAASTAMDNSKEALDRVIAGLSVPPEPPRPGDLK